MQPADKENGFRTMKDTKRYMAIRLHKKRYRDAKTGLIFALIPVVGYLLFNIIPQIMSLLMSFGDVPSVYFDEMTFTGLGNYKAMLTDVRFWKALGNTFFYAISTVVCIVLGLAVALLLNRKSLKMKGFYRVVFFIPYVCSIVATSIMWQWIFESDYGILNGITTKFFGESARVRWLQEPGGFRFAILLMSIWGGYGYNVLLYQSALAAVDQNLYEAADLDGANAWKKFVHVTLPGISPTTFYMMTMGLIGSMQAFTTQQVWGGSSGGPEQAGLTAVYYVYIMGISAPASYGMGLACAASWLLAIFIFIATRFCFWTSKFWVSED